MTSHNTKIDKRKGRDDITQHKDDKRNVCVVCVCMTFTFLLSSVCCVTSSLPFLLSSLGCVTSSLPFLSTLPIFYRCRRLWRLRSKRQVRERRVHPWYRASADRFTRPCIVVTPPLIVIHHRRPVLSNRRKQLTRGKFASRRCAGLSHHGRQCRRLCGIFPSHSHNYTTTQPSQDGVCRGSAIHGLILSRKQ
jgi:hypothetical protein